MKLNLGCGPYYATGWTNLEIPGTQYRCDIEADFNLLARSPEDFAPEVKNLSAVFMGHFLEHISLDTLVLALPELRKRMLPGAPIAVVGPDVKKAYDMFQRGLIPFSLYELCKKHHNPTDGHSHLWDCDAESVMHLLSAAGFQSIHEVNLAQAAPPNPSALHHFPVVAYDRWQCAVMAAA